LTGSAQLNLGPASQFDGDVTFVSPRLFLNGTTFNGITYLEKNGASNDDGTGGNIFNQLATLVNSGSAYLLTASTSPDTFNSKLIILNSGSSTIRLSDNASGNVFAGNIEVNSTFGGGIYFGNQAAGTSTLTAGNTISVGTTGVISGDIRLIRFTQVGPTAQALDLSGIAILTLGPSSTFDGNVDFRAPQVLLNGTTYNGVTYLEKKGATDNVGTGGNTFNSATTLVNSGSGYLLTANASPDIFASTLTVTNTGSNIIYLAHNVSGSQFNGNITFNSTLGSQGIYFANNTTGNATLGTGASLSVGGLGFSSGELRFRRFTQIGNASQTLVLTGTGLLRIGPSSTFNGVLDFRAPRLALDGCIYNGTTYLEKTGATTDNSSGGNVFNAVTTLANSGSGIFANANTTLDTFNGDITLTNTGTASIRMADNIPGTVFNGNIIVNSTNTTSGSGIYFSNNVATANATLAAGRTISVGATGFTAGELRLIRFTQLGATAQTLTLTGTAILQLGASSTFNGDVNFRSPQLIINSTIFNRSAYLEKTGATNNTGAGGATFANGFTATIVNSGSGQLRTNGGHTFNGTTTLLNSGTADFLLELTTPSNYNGDVTMTNTGTSNIRAAYTGANTFNGNITVNSSAGIGIYFCENATGTATLASGRTISVGSGFSAGELRLQRFTQSGTTSQNITLTSSATFRSGPSAIWNGPLTVSSPILFLDGTTLNGTTNSITKTGSSTDSSTGGNIFGGTSTFTNSGTGIFRFANTTADDFTGNVIFNQASGTIQPAYNIPSTFRGDVTVN
ncbi:MAG: beta strand repeat-containing protein, partial [Cyclobacteriaceae bacterium]